MWKNFETKAIAFITSPIRRIGEWWLNYLHYVVRSETQSQLVRVAAQRNCDAYLVADRKATTVTKVRRCRSRAWFVDSSAQIRFCGFNFCRQHLTLPHSCGLHNVFTTCLCTIISKNLIYAIVKIKTVKTSALFTDTIASIAWERGYYFRVVS